MLLNSCTLEYDKSELIREIKVVCLCTQTCIQQHAKVKGLTCHPVLKRGLFFPAALWCRLGSLQVSRQLSPIPVNPIKVLGWQVCTTRSRLSCEFQESCISNTFTHWAFHQTGNEGKGPQTHISVLTLMGSGGGRTRILNRNPNL